MQINRGLILVLVLATVVLASVQVVGAETAHVANHVVISEIMINGAHGEEFVELYNPTNSEVSLNGWEWCYYSRTANWDSPDNHKTFPDGANIKSHGFYLIGLKGYPTTGGNPNSDWQPYTTHRLSNDKGSVAIFPDTTYSEANCIDAVAWGNVDHIKEGSEASKHESGQSIERKAIASSSPTTMAPSGTHYTWGNGEDTNDNSADFITKASPEPQNSFSATEDCPAQSWFLSSTSGGSCYIMYKEDMSKPEDTVTVSDGSSEIWIANEPATVGVGFPAGTWTGRIILKATSTPDEAFTVEVGRYGGDTFTLCSTPQEFSGYGTPPVTLSLSISAKSIHCPTK